VNCAYRRYDAGQVVQKVKEEVQKAKSRYLTLTAREKTEKK